MAPHNPAQTEHPHRRADSVIVLDFETSGLSPDQGERAIEIGAVRIEQGHITERFQSLMNPGRRVNAFIENYTGISNAMLRKAPPNDEVMMRFAEFAADVDLVAHNASFDQRFLQAELRRINLHSSAEFACSLLLARRIYQDAANHQLATLVALKGIAHDGTFHRALADAQMTAHLWLKMLDDIAIEHQISTIPFTLVQKISRLPKASVHRFLRRWAANQH